MPAVTGRHALAGVMMAASLAGALLSVRMQTDHASLMMATRAAQLVPLPEQIVRALPGGAPLPPPQPPLRPAQRAALVRSMVATPLDPKLFNIFYADQVRRALSDAVINRDARTLARLGWRWTPAQQNLITRAILTENFRQIVDRADALLRRQKLPGFAFAMLMTMEAVPQVQGEVVAKLRAQPRWRHDYLTVIGPQSPPPLLAARVRTINALLRTPAGLSREELAPSLIALAAGEYGPQALALWRRKTGAPSGGNMVYDPAFQQAARLSGTQDLQIPFEWRMGQDLGYSVQATPAGVAIDWDRRGAPTFLSQLVSAEGVRRLRLTLHGRASSAALTTLLSPTIVCGATTVQFAPVGDRSGETQFVSDVLPGDCAMGVLTLNGAVDSGSGSVTIDITRITLRSDA